MFPLRRPVPALAAVFGAPAVVAGALWSPDVVVIGVCAALVAAGAVAVVRWGAGGAQQAAVPRVPVVHYAGIVMAAGLVAGLVATGAGGRLAMRVLALTSPKTRGVFTEGGAEIGEITIDGTLAFFTFAGVPSGLLSGALYAVLQPLLPRGRAGGPAFGVVLLVLAGTRVDPLRADNFDFALVGPDWLSVLLFVALALFQGSLVAALVGRLWGARPTVSRSERSRRMLLAGRVAVAVLVLAALPGFVIATADILTS